MDQPIKFILDKLSAVKSRPRNDVIHVNVTTLDSECRVSSLISQELYQIQISLIHRQLM
jgi:hypothetical protein